MPMLRGAIVFDETRVQRLEERRDFLQAVGDGAGGQIKIVATQFGEDAVQRLEELELVLQDEYPQRDADVAFGNELVGRRRGEHARLIGAAALAAITFAMIATAMGADIDFEDVAVGGAGDFFERFAALATRFLRIGQIVRFVGGGQMVVVASAMAFAAGLLAALAFRFVVWIIGIGRLRGGRGFGFSTEESAFEFAELAFEKLDSIFALGLALDGPLMLGLPVVRLLA